MAVIDYLVSEPPQSVYLFPTPVGPKPRQNEALFFQYWPQTLTDDYQVEYAEHAIPGGTHPLYQWVGGRGRTLTFQAVFTSEINTNRKLAGAGVNDAATVAGQVTVGNNLLPSSPYTVDVAAALARLRSWMRPKLGQGGKLGETDPPKILTLVFPNTRLNGSNNAVTVILRAAPINHESWFPDGQIRLASVDLTFSEIVQTPYNENGGSSVKFIDRTNFETDAKKYRFRGLPDRPLMGGGG